MSTAMRVSTIVTSRYATALLDLAEKGKSLEKVEQDLKDLDAMIAASDDLRSFIANPVLSRVSQENAVAALFKKAGFQALTLNFVTLLIRNKRLAVLPQVVRAVQKMLAERRGEKRAVVTVAQDLSAKQREALEKSLAKAAGASVALHIKVDPSILGGMIVTMDSKMIDDSVARKLERLKTVMETGANENIRDNNLSEVV